MTGTNRPWRLYFFNLARRGCRRRFACLSRIDINGAADFDPALADTRRNQMLKIVLFFPLVLMASEVWAQQGHDACARDVSRFCRAHMNDGDSVVLACLKQHRSRISRACDKIMTENGQ
jgi:hypothetical protein